MAVGRGSGWDWFSILCFVSVVASCHELDIGTNQNQTNAQRATPQGGEAGATPQGGEAGATPQGERAGESGFTGGEQSRSDQTEGVFVPSCIMTTGSTPISFQFASSLS